jgi:hypothetical protein
MTKRELIDEITHLNPTARPDFLAEFGDEDLAEYLEHLKWLDEPALAQASAASRPDGSTDPPPGEADPPSAPPSAEVVEEDQTPKEPLAVAAGQAEQDPSPFAKHDAQEDSQTWLF